MRQRAAIQAKAAVRVNVGGQQFRDREGNLWAPDQAYHAGSWGCLDMPDTYVLTTTDAIADADDASLFQSLRVGEEIRYRFDLPNGTYQVRLLFAEIYWESNAAERQEVFIQGKRVLENFGVFSEVGHDAALEKTFTAKITDGRLEVRFVGVSLPMHAGANVCAIEITRAGK
jgi:hypothetical protein